MDHDPGQPTDQDRQEPIAHRHVCWSLTLSPEGLVDRRLNFHALLDVHPVLSLFNTLGEGGKIVGPSQLVPEHLRVTLLHPPT